MEESEKPTEAPVAEKKTEEVTAAAERKPKTHKVLVKKQIVKKTKRVVPPLIGDLFSYIEG